MTPEEMQRQLRENPRRFADDLEVRGRGQMRDPATELAGRLRVHAAEQLRARLDGRDEEPRLL